MFNSKFYLNTKGCSTSTICDPGYTNIFMAEFEQKHTYPLMKDKDFMNELNQEYSSIKTDLKFHYKQIEFLDTLVYVD